MSRFNINSFNGPVECSSSQGGGGGGGGTAQHSSSMTGTTQDRDMVIVMEYLTLVIGVLITLTRDPRKRKLLHSDFYDGDNK